MDECVCMDCWCLPARTCPIHAPFPRRLPREVILITSPTPFFVMLQCKSCERLRSLSNIFFIVNFNIISNKDFFTVNFIIYLIIMIMFVFVWLSKLACTELLQISFSWKIFVSRNECIISYRSDIWIPRDKNHFTRTKFVSEQKHAW